MRVLIVEDVPFMANAAKCVLAQGNIESDIAPEPNAAQSLVDTNAYDAILMDFGLPVMTGLELTRVLREKGFDKPIIGLTANADKYSVEDMKKAGLNSCVGKPLTTDDFHLLFMESNQGWIENGKEEGSED